MMNPLRPVPGQALRLALLPLLVLLSAPALAERFSDAERRVSPPAPLLPAHLKPRPTPTAAAVEAPPAAEAGPDMAGPPLAGPDREADDPVPLSAPVSARPAEPLTPAAPVEPVAPVQAVAPAPPPPAARALRLYYAANATDLGETEQEALQMLLARVASNPALQIVAHVHVPDAQSGRLAALRQTDLAQRLQQAGLFGDRVRYQMLPFAPNPANPVAAPKSPHYTELRLLEPGS